MFERFTERSREVVVEAQKEARAAKHDHIRSVHLLLGLIAVEGGQAAQVLDALGVKAEAVRMAMDRLYVKADSVPDGQIPFTPDLKQVLDGALREALSLGHNYIGTEHILLSLVRSHPGNHAKQLLEAVGVNAEDVRNQALRMLVGRDRVTERKVVAPPKIDLERFGQDELLSALTGLVNAITGYIAAMTPEKRA